MASGSGDLEAKRAWLQTCLGMTPERTQSQRIIVANGMTASISGPTADSSAAARQAQDANKATRADTLADFRAAADSDFKEEAKGRWLRADPQFPAAGHPGAAG